MPAENDTRALYAVLGVAADATAEDIKIAYRRLALAHHPDRRRNNTTSGEDNTTTFARIAFAYEVLGNEQRRKRYDLSGELPQSDAALGKAAGETFLAEYVKSAPTVARTVTNKDMSLHNLDNYEVLDVDGKDVPEYMRGIVMIGLNYLVSVVDDMEQKEVVLLRHYVMDQMYALIAYTPPLDDSAFAERGYIITYYDHPLQSGIAPSWSDQNTLGGTRAARDQVQLKEIDQVTMERRKLAALEWHGYVANTSADAKPPPAIPGEGTGPDRMQLAVRALVKREQDPMSLNASTLRRGLEKLLGVEEGALQSHSAVGLMGYVLEAMEEDDDQAPDETVDDIQPAAATAPEAHPLRAETTGKHSCTIGSTVLVKRSGRVGEVILHDPSDPDLTYKVKFSDGQNPETDWCPADGVTAHDAAA